MPTYKFRIIYEIKNLLKVISVKRRIVWTNTSYVKYFLVLGFTSKSKKETAFVAIKFRD